MNRRSDKIILSGGGTGGSVTPLLAVAVELYKDDCHLDFLFVGSKFGPEKDLVSEFAKRIPMRFVDIPAGKWRRYFSFSNLLDIFKIGLAFFVSLKILKQEKPALVMTAGSFISVPLAWAAACLKIPILVHQQDIRPGLANKLMAPLARAVTIAFEKSFIDYGPRAIWTGNPTAEIVNQVSRLDVFNQYNLIPHLPLVLVIGGGTGSLAINKLIISALPELVDFCQVIHLTGRGKSDNNFNKPDSRYHYFELLPHDEMMKIMSVADLVISRCGLGVLTALSHLRKPAILIPMPDSHQEDNAAVFSDANASLVVSQKNISTAGLIKDIHRLLNDKNLLQQYTNNISHVMKSRAAENISAVVWEIIGPKGNK